MRIFMLLLSFVALVSLSACGPRAFVKGKYDPNVEDENLLADQWSETDMQVVVKSLVDSLVKDNAIAGAEKKPILMVTKLQNKTSEHIDTQSVMDMIRVELSERGRVQFVDKLAREDISEEYEYQGGMVTESTRSSPGQQMGAKYILNGRLDSITQQAGSEKTVYYKITLNLTDLKSGLIEWTDHKQIRKKYRKKHVGL